MARYAWLRCWSSCWSLRSRTGLLDQRSGSEKLKLTDFKVIEGLTVLFAPGYHYERWQGTLIIITVATFSVLFNTFLARHLPKIELFMLACHVLGFFAILIPLWVCGPHNSASDVFTMFTNSGGWPSTGLSCLVGLTAPVFSLIGPDSAVHMGTLLSLLLQSWIPSI